MAADIKVMLDNAGNLADIFEVVKEAVRQSTGKSRGGLMLGLADMGNHPDGFFGAFFPVGTNIIVMNKIPLQRIKDTRPELYKPYAFHVLLHEYIHTLGYLDEGDVRQRAYDVSLGCLGADHLATRMAANITQFIPNIAYPTAAWQPKGFPIELVPDFDRSSVGYIN
jgi:hypothetical protein